MSATLVRLNLAAPICETRPPADASGQSPVGRIDVDGLARDRDQLWAEAKIRFESGGAWWLETTDLVQMVSDQQIERYEGDPWKEVIGPWLDVRTSVFI